MTGLAFRAEPRRRARRRRRGGGWSERAGRALQSGGSDEIFSERESTFDTVSVLYDGLGGNMLDADHVAAAIHFEGALLEAPVWGLVCKLEYSTLDPSAPTARAADRSSTTSTRTRRRTRRSASRFCTMPAAYMARDVNQLGHGHACPRCSTEARRRAAARVGGGWPPHLRHLRQLHGLRAAQQGDALVDHTCSLPDAGYLKADYKMGCRSRVNRRRGWSTSSRYSSAATRRP